ncbi:hypothetical protein SAMN05216344_12261 [Polaromonas sp. OV174]|nr:hypothetical protein SAMN05216344_12261 [Polaromonas sp. OV174]
MAYTYCAICCFKTLSVNVFLRTFGKTRPTKCVDNFVGKWQRSRRRGTPLRAPDKMMNF